MSYTIRKFQPETDVVKPFDCGQADLNGFLLETNSDAPNATLYDKEFLAVTYVAVDDMTHSILAYFSLLNDKIDREFVEPTIWNRLSRKIPNASGFTRLSDPREDDETVLLFFDLKSWSQTRGT